VEAGSSPAATAKGRIGRLSLHHREVPGGMLWVARTGSSWREMPEEFGKWDVDFLRVAL
jgi:transposase